MNKPAKKSPEAPTATKKTEEESKQPLFNFFRHYVKDVSLEFPSAPQIFQSTENNSLKLNINAENNKVDEHVYEVSLMVNVSVVSPAEKTMLLIECKYAGLFEINNVSDKDLQLLLNVHSLEIIFPYLRETISNLSVKTSLQPILLPPTNFSALYEQRKANEKSKIIT